MGLSQYGFALFIARQKMGSGLGRVLTLGRQRAAMGYGNAERLVREAGLVWNADKLEPTSPWGDSTLLAAGAQTVNSMDYSTHESCSIVHDLNHPVKGDLVGAFDTVFDGGTLEHVCDFPTAMRNCITMLADGGVFMAGAFIAYYAVVSGVPFWAAALLGTLGAGLISVLIEIVAFRPLRARGQSEFAAIVASIGVDLILVSIAQRVSRQLRAMIVLLPIALVSMSWLAPMLAKKLRGNEAATLG